MNFPSSIAAMAGFALACASGRADQVIYNDALENGWQVNPWAACVLTNSSPVHSGTASMAVTCEAFQALDLTPPAALDTTPYTNLVLWLNGGDAGGQALTIQVRVNNTAQAQYPLPVLAADTWAKFTIPLSALGASATTSWRDLYIYNFTGSDIATFYVDDISLEGGAAPAPMSLSTAPARDDGQIEFWVAGPAGATFILQESMDLLTWNSTVTNTLGAAPFHFLRPMTSSSHFYRALQAP